MEQDPNGKAANEAGAKLDNGKIDMSLLLMFSRALEAVADVGTQGAKKYTRGGWQEVPDGITRYTAAMLRHLTKEDRELLDADLTERAGHDILHAACVAWNALARLELILRNKDELEKELGYNPYVEAWQRDWDENYDDSGNLLLKD